MGQARAAEQQRRRVDDLLEVVQQQQQLALSDVRGELVLGAQRLCDRLQDEGGVSERGQTDPENAVPVLGDQLAADSIASRVLPAPPGPDSVTNLAPSRSSETTSATSRPRPTNESPGAAGSCSRSSSAAGSALAELEDRDRLREVLQPVLAEIAQHPRRRARASPPRAAPGRRGPRRLSGPPDARPLRRNPPRTRNGWPVCTPIADADRPATTRAAPLRPRRRARPPTEGEEERVPLRSRPRAAAPVERTTQHPPMLAQRLRVALAHRARRSSRVEPSMSVKTKVTVPEGSSRSHEP